MFTDEQFTSLVHRYTCDAGVGFAQLKAVSPIVLEDVSCFLLGDGTILNIPG